MGKARSDDLRMRVVEAVMAGASRHQAAARFQVGVSSAIRWVRLFKETGSVGLVIDSSVADELHRQ